MPDIVVFSKVELKEALSYSGGISDILHVVKPHVPITRSTSAIQ